MSSTLKTSPTTGPTTLSTEGFVDLSVYSNRAGLEADLFITPELADLVLERSWVYDLRASEKAWSLTQSFLKGMDSMLADDKRSQYSSFYFKHWCRMKKTDTKDRMVRVRAEIFQTEKGDLWVALAKAPVRH